MVVVQDDENSTEKSLMELFLKIGMDEQTAMNTIADHELTTILTEVIHQAGVTEEGCCKDVGYLLYLVATKFPANALVHRPTLLEYIVSSKIKSTAQLDAAIHFLGEIGGENLQWNEFEQACGIAMDHETDITFDGLFDGEGISHLLGDEANVANVGAVVGGDEDEDEEVIILDNIGFTFDGLDEYLNEYYQPERVGDGSDEAAEAAEVVREEVQAALGIEGEEVQDNGDVRGGEVGGGGGRATVVGGVIGDEGAGEVRGGGEVGGGGVNEATVVHGSQFHEVTSFDVLKAHLAAAKDPSQTVFLEPRIYLAFIMNARDLPIQEHDPTKFKDCILCAYPAKEKKLTYKDGVTYMKVGRITGDLANFEVNGRKGHSFSRYTYVNEIDDFFTERRKYQFKDELYAVLHYRKVPKHQASQELQLLLSRSAQPTVDNNLLSRSAQPTVDNNIISTSQTEVKLDKILDRLEAQRGELQAYRDEVHAYRDELHAYRDELHAYRDELHAWMESRV